VAPGSAAKLAVVGTGNVGASFAYAAVLWGLASEIVLVDANTRRAEGEAMDLLHAVPFTKAVRVSAGTIEDCAGSVVTVVAAGAAQRPGETRLDLIRKNAAIFERLIPPLAQANPDGIILVATNPVDALSYHAWRLSGLPSGRVFGSGTILDTARFRVLLAEHFDVDPRSVHAFIVGEHGDSEVPVWSMANIAGMSLEAFAAANGRAHDQAALDEIFVHTRDAAYEIIERKGSTHFAVAAGLLRIVEAILRDQRTVLSVSSRIDPSLGLGDVFLSLPAIVGRAGVERVLHLPLAADELAGLRRSASVLRDALGGIDHAATSARS
jgi:L-lactate dehydrogenase